jgi:peptidoglycan/xylan/chitin deacetylase (PgdA/CDA1 family)
VIPTRSTARAAVGLAAVAGVVHAGPGVVSWRQMRCRLLPRLSGVGHTGHVALTFDDGPDPDSTPAFLDELDRLGVRATFFCLGQQVRRDRGLVAEVVARGHELGVHGDAHTNHLRRPATWTVPDLCRARDLVADAGGVEPRWCRPPYGALSASSLVAARAAGLQLVLWTSWGRDWRPDATPESVTEDVVRTGYPGATVLLHDSDITSAPGCWRTALAALAPLAGRWHADGLVVGTLGEHGIGAARRAAPVGAAPAAGKVGSTPGDRRRSA